MKPILAAAVCLPLMLTGCVTSGEAPLSRTLPPRTEVVPDPMPLPVIRAGGDVVTALAETRVVASENGRRLAQAGARYDHLRGSYADP